MDQGTASTRYHLAAAVGAVDVADAVVAGAAARKKTVDVRRLVWQRQPWPVHQHLECLYGIELEHARSFVPATSFCFQTR